EPGGLAAFAAARHAVRLGRLDGSHGAAFGDKIYPARARAGEKGGGEASRRHCFWRGVGQGWQRKDLTTTTTCQGESWITGSTTPRNPKSICACSRLDSGRWFSTALMNNWDTSRRWRLEIANRCAPIRLHLGNCALAIFASTTTCRTNLKRS